MPSWHLFFYLKLIMTVLFINQLTDCMKNDDKDILNFMNNELRVGLKFMSERDVIIIFSIEKRE